MITAVDTNILLDVLIPGAKEAGRSKRLLDDCLGDGSLAICEVVFAELCATFKDHESLEAFLRDTGIRFLPSSHDALAAAGAAWRAYTRRRSRTGIECGSCGSRTAVACAAFGKTVPVKQHILTDFLVGAHASLLASRLLTRDLGYYRTYFPALALVGADREA